MKEQLPTIVADTEDFAVDIANCMDNCVPKAKNEWKKALMHYSIAMVVKVSETNMTRDTSKRIRLMVEYAQLCEQETALLRCISRMNNAVPTEKAAYLGAKLKNLREQLAKWRRYTEEMARSGAEKSTPGEPGKKEKEVSLYEQ